jgi:hypothetical protein
MVYIVLGLSLSHFDPDGLWHDFSRKFLTILTDAAPRRDTHATYGRRGLLEVGGRNGSSLVKGN